MLDDIAPGDPLEATKPEPPASAVRVDCARRVFCWVSSIWRCAAAISLEAFSVSWAAW